MFVLLLSFLFTAKAYALNRKDRYQFTIIDQSYDDKSHPTLTLKRRKTLLALTVKMCSLARFTPSVRVSESLTTVFFACYDEQYAKKTTINIEQSNRDKRLERYIFAQRYASKLNINREMLVELYEFAIQDPVITLADTVVMGATARIESRWIPSALSPDRCDLGVFQTRCKSLGEVCDKKYNFKKGKNNCSEESLILHATQNFLQNKEPISEFSTQLQWFKSHMLLMQKHYKTLKKKINNIAFDKKLSKKYNYKYMVLYPGYSDNLYTIRTKRIQLIEEYIARYQRGLYLWDKGQTKKALMEFKENPHFIHSKFTAYRYIASYKEKRISY